MQNHSLETENKEKYRMQYIEYWWHGTKNVLYLLQWEENTKQSIKKVSIVLNVVSNLAFPDHNFWHRGLAISSMLKDNSHKSTDCGCCSATKKGVVIWAQLNNICLKVFQICGELAPGIFSGAPDVQRINVIVTSVALWPHMQQCKAAIFAFLVVERVMCVTFLRIYDAYNMGQELAYNVRNISIHSALEDGFALFGKVLSPFALPKANIKLTSIQWVRIRC